MQPWTISKLIEFLRQDVWRIRLKELTGHKRLLIKLLRIIILAIRGFKEDKCSLRASALTFYSMLSVVPVVAMAFGVARGFGLEKLLEDELFEQLKGQEEVITWIITWANSMVESVKGGLIAGIGVLILFALTVMLLDNIESSFNEIWGITHARKWSRKLSNYLAIMLICPFLLIIYGSMTVLITTQITHVTEKIDLLGPMSPVILIFLRALPYGVVWLLFSFIYLFMPNTKIRVRSGLLGGVVAGTFYILVQWVYITFQIGVSRYGAIYGGFAAVPLFMVWMQMSWMVVLFGAEISFAHQNVESYEFEPDSLKVSPSFKKLLALGIVHACVKNFRKGDRPWTAGQISNNLEIPIKLVNQILFELEQCQILSETLDAESNDPRYQPARSVDTLSIHYVIHALDSLGSRDIPVAQSEELTKLSESMRNFASILEKSDANLLLKDV
ncbi:MAG: YihY/virulence factor BrkB family protein [Deltaproteobacteria bacterium]|nr:YihY/virulence factor BrkB family protein [Deltaproteobacteria bacterium]